MLEWLRRLFKRRSALPFQPRNHLERLLVRASTEPAARPEFLRAVMDCTLCVIGQVGDGPPAEEERRVVRKGELLHILMISYQGRSVLAVFSSPERVAEFAPGSTYVAMTARELLENIGSQELLLNPGSAYGKHFLAEEIQGLLDGSAFPPRQRWVAEEDTRMQIGRPAKYPTQLVEELRALFERRGDVTRAYVALILIPSRSATPNYFVAIEADGDLAAIAADCGIVASATLRAGEYTDIGSTTIAPDYFAADEPFYTRS